MNPTTEPSTLNTAVKQTLQTEGDPTMITPTFPKLNLLDCISNATDRNERFWDGLIMALERRPVRNMKAIQAITYAWDFIQAPLDIAETFLQRRENARNMLNWLAYAQKHGARVIICPPMSKANDAETVVFIDDAKHVARVAKDDIGKAPKDDN